MNIVESLAAKSTADTGPNFIQVSGDVTPNEESINWRLNRMLRNALSSQFQRTKAHSSFSATVGIQAFSLLTYSINGNKWSTEHWSFTPPVKSLVKASPWESKRLKDESETYWKRWLIMRGAAQKPHIFFRSSSSTVDLFISLFVYFNNIFLAKAISSNMIYDIMCAVLTKTTLPVRCHEKADLTAPVYQLGCFIGQDYKALVLTNKHETASGLSKFTHSITLGYRCSPNAKVLFWHSTFFSQPTNKEGTSKYEPRSLSGFPSSEKHQCGTTTLNCPYISISMVDWFISLGFV